MMLWRFARGVAPTRVQIQQFANLPGAICSLSLSAPETVLHVAVCDALWLLWFRLLGLHLQELIIL